MRAKSRLTTLTFNPLPRKEGEEVIGSGSGIIISKKIFGSGLAFFYWPQSSNLLLCSVHQGKEAVTASLDLSFSVLSVIRFILSLSLAHRILFVSGWPKTSGCR